ncbi:MAG: 4-phosphoerythronate dehydrogenase [Lysobacterales bacterium]
MTTMQIVIDQNIVGANETFAHHGQVLRVDGRKLHPEQLRKAKALIVRSVTRVDSTLLENSPVRFVGTTTIGTEHLDTAWLEQNGITWAGAPGCNADAAAQYTLAMMLLSGQKIGFELSRCKVGIVGYGNVGSRLCRLLRALGHSQLTLNDPPRADTGQPGLSELEHITRCDVISFHVPLSMFGKHATYGMIDEEFFSRLKPGALLVNTARGKLMNSRPLLEWLRSGRGFAALDVFPEEPGMDLELLDACTVATPHVAGYSLDGKISGTLMVYRQFCDWLNSKPAEHTLLRDLETHTFAPEQSSTLADAILTCCPVERDDENLRRIAGMEPGRRAAWFDILRRDYPPRRDFSGWIRPTDAPDSLAHILENLGFH